MTRLSNEIRAYSRACEHLLSTETTLNDDERSLVEYYVKEVSRRFISAELSMQTQRLNGVDKPNMRARH